MPIAYVTSDAFTPDRDPWVPVGPIAAVREEAEGEFLLTLRDAPLAVRLAVVSPACIRVRFNPRPDADIPTGISHAIVGRAPGPVPARIVENSAERLCVEVGTMRVEIDLQDYCLRLFRGSQLICADRPGRGLVYRPGEHGIAGFKLQPSAALYCGFGEKTGARLLKNGGALSNFNFDNFIYARAPVPPGEDGGPLNGAEPLYASIPLLIEINPAPGGADPGPPYCYGLFLDNVSQSFFGLDGGGSYSFGALYGELDYYLFVGDKPADIVREFTELTGRSAMPPRYAFGYHQGCYGYFDRERLERVARSHREARIPIDGLHIDIDFQNNYRIFTHSEMKFPDAAGMMAGLHAAGFKCSTVVTPLVTTNPLDERGEMVPFAQRQQLLAAGALLYDVRAGGGQQATAELFSAGVSYGADRGYNTYSYPPLVPNRDGVTPLGATMNYPDIGRREVQALWSSLYAHLLNDLGIDMVWQDMMCPAAAISADTPAGTLPLDLMTADRGTYVPHGVCHNAYAQCLAQATYEGMRSLRPEVRPFILARGGYAGLQRYAALWTGDNASSWDFLRITLPQILNIGLSGIPLSGADVGGFAPGPVPEGSTSASVVRDGRVIGGITDPELFVRWMQAGSYLPWFRNHYLGYDKEYQEVYAYGGAVADVCRAAIERRYRLLQLFYDAMYEWTQTGMPIARALFLNDPDDLAVYSHLDDQFFVGRDLLVAPILFPGAAGGSAVRDVYLPAGSDWFVFDDGEGSILGEPVRGGQLLSGVPAGLDQVPVFIRAGAIIPLRLKGEQYVGELAENPLVVCIYPGPDADYLLYQDDGISTRAERDGAYRTTRISHAAVAGGRRIRLQRLNDGYAPAERFLLVRLSGIAAPLAVDVDGNHLPPAASAAALDDATADACLWDRDSRVLTVKVFDRAELTIDVGPQPV